jgi:hypothetical protein
VTEITADLAKYPAQTSFKTIGFFSTLERAETCMRSEANTRAHHFTIKTRLLSGPASEHLPGSQDFMGLKPLP